MTKFSVKVPSLKRLTTYTDYRNEEGSGRSLVIDSPALRYLKIVDPSGDYRIQRVRN